MIQSAARVSLTGSESVCQTTDQANAPHPLSDARACSALPWYVGEANFHQIKMAVDSVTSRGFEAFLPVTLLTVRKRVSGAQASSFSLALRPMLFQFFFVRCDVSGVGWPARDTRSGFLGLLNSMSGRPRPCRAGEVEVIISKSDADRERASRPPRKLLKLQPGETVLVMRGPMEGKVGTVERCNGYNTEVWLTAFGGVFKVKLLRENVSAE